MVVSLLLCIACEAGNPKVIDLSSTEKAKLLGMVTQRHQIEMDREAVTATYQSEMDALNEKETRLNIECKKFGFSVKQAHSIGGNARYALDETKGQLILQP